MVEYILEELTSKIGSGATPRGGSNSYLPSGISLVRSQNVHDLKFSTGGLVFINEEQARKLNNVTVKEGDVLLNITGDSIARVCLMPSDLIPARVNQHVAIIRANDKVNNEYLCYYLHNMKPHLLRICKVGGTRNALTKDALQNLPIRVQNNSIELANTLSTLDKKIDLNNQINAELESMAKLIYDYWFVQFDFPISAEQAKAMGKPKLEGRPYKSSGGKMVWNEEMKREVPEGWGVGELQDVADITMGQSPPGTSFNQEQNGMVFYQGSTDFGWRYPTNRLFTTDPKRLAKSGDILMSVRAPVGTLNMADENCCIGRGIAAIRGRNDNFCYVQGVMNNLKQIFDRRNATGTTFGSITKGDLFSIKTIIPVSDVMTRFENLIMPMNSKIEILSKENQELSSLRDWLLPMLMNGQVKVGE